MTSWSRERENLGILGKQNRTAQRHQQKTAGGRDKIMDPRVTKKDIIYNKNDDDDGSAATEPRSVSVVIESNQEQKEESGNPFAATTTTTTTTTGPPEPPPLPEKKKHKVEKSRERPDYLDIPRQDPDGEEAEANGGGIDEALREIAKSKETNAPDEEEEENHHTGCCCPPSAKKKRRNGQQKETIEMHDYTLSAQNPNI